MQQHRETEDDRERQGMVLLTTTERREGVGDDDRSRKGQRKMVKPLIDEDGDDAVDLSRKGKEEVKMVTEEEVLQQRKQ